MRLTDEATDADLMARTARGDRDAFTVIYRRYSATVFRFARLMTGCATAAEDVVQEAFLALMRDASRYDATRASLATYLYGVARYQTRRRLRRERRFVALSAGGDVATTASGPVDSMVRHDELARLRSAILSLPSRYREVLVLCELQDVTYADAARVMGCAVGTVRSRLHRARALLGEKMQRTANAQVRTMRCAV